LFEEAVVPTPISEGKQFDRETGLWRDAERLVGQPLLPRWLAFAVIAMALVLSGAGVFLGAHVDGMVGEAQMMFASP